MPPLIRLRQIAADVASDVALDVQQLLPLFGCTPHRERYINHSGGRRPLCEVAIPEDIHEVLYQLLSRMWRETTRTPIPISFRDHALSTYEHIIGMKHGQNSMVPNRTIYREHATGDFMHWLKILCGLPRMCAQIFKINGTPGSMRMEALETILKSLYADMPPWSIGMELVVSGWNYTDQRGQKRIYLALCGLQTEGHCFRLITVVHTAIGANGFPTHQWRSDFSMSTATSYPKLCFELYTLVRKAAYEYCDGHVLDRWQNIYVPLHSHGPDESPIEQIVLVRVSQVAASQVASQTASQVASQVAAPSVANSLIDELDTSHDVEFNFDDTALPNQPSTPMISHTPSLDGLSLYGLEDPSLYDIRAPSLYDLEDSSPDGLDAPSSDDMAGPSSDDMAGPSPDDM
jgi:hypothetical protein